MGVYEKRTKTVTLEDSGHKYEYEIGRLTGIQSEIATDKAKKIIAEIGQPANVTLMMSLYDPERLRMSVISAKCDGKNFDFGKELDSMPRNLFYGLLAEVDKLSYLKEEEVKNSEGQSEEKSPTLDLPQNMPSQ